MDVRGSIGWVAFALGAIACVLNVLLTISLLGCSNGTSCDGTVLIATFALTAPGCLFGLVAAVMLRGGRPRAASLVIVAASLFAALVSTVHMAS